ncbi:MAG: pentapeptide repeat-containing protein [Cytophagales bacterium]|nr:pentapeptide repeat-containing protein [Cytophagales bacterium]
MPAFPEKSGVALLGFIFIFSFKAIAQDFSGNDVLKSYEQIGEFVIDKNINGEDSITFLNEVILEYVGIDPSLTFYSSVFQRYVSIDDVNFKGPGNFLFAVFLSEFNAGRLNFEQEAYFEESRFEGDFFLSGHFKGNARFASAEFHSDAMFSGETQFYQLADFQGARFLYDADFSLSVFKADVQFNYTRFGEVAYFDDARFEREASFLKIQLPDTLSFRNIRTNSIIDLTSVELDSAQLATHRKCYLDLRDAPIDKFKLRYDQFQVFWPEKIGASDYESLTNVYEGLLKNFKDRVYLTSYETLDKEYQAFKDLQNPNASPIKKMMNRVNFYWNNYGYNKERIWLWTLIFLLISTLVNWLAFPYLSKVVYPIEIIDTALYEGKPWRRKQFKTTGLLWNKVHGNVKYFSLAFFYTSLIFFGLKISTDRMNYRKPVGIILIYTEYLLGLICLGYLANFIISSGLIGQ